MTAVNHPNRNFTSTRLDWPLKGQTDPTVYNEFDEWPRISIITPSFNQGKYLEETIMSVLAQNYPNLEYIIIDGGSSDDSVEIIRKYERELKYWVSEKDSGQTEALHKGFQQATGEIAAWINSDDYYELNTFFKVAKYYIGNKFEFFCGSCQMIDTGGKQIMELYSDTIDHASLVKYWKPHFCPPQPSIFFDRNCLMQLNPFEKDLRYTMDFDIWLRAVRKFSFLTVRDNLSYYRVHLDSKTGSRGGLKKFIPEWKMLIQDSLKDQPLGTRVKWRIGAVYHDAVQNLKRNLTLKNFRSAVGSYFKS